MASSGVRRLKMNRMTKTTKLAPPPGKKGGNYGKKSTRLQTKK